MKRTKRPSQPVSFLQAVAAVVAAAGLTTAAPALAAVGDCGQPVSDSVLPKASDALFVLRAAVGSEVCELCICDVDASGDVRASDALRVLKAAVGIEIVLDCGPGCGSTTTTSTTSTTSTSSTSSTTMGNSAIERGREIYDLDCASCHKAGSYDPNGFAGNLAGKGSLPNDMGDIDGSMSGLVYSNDEIVDLLAFLNSL